LHVNVCTIVNMLLLQDKHANDKLVLCGCMECTLKKMLGWKLQSKIMRLSGWVWTCIVHRTFFIHDNRWLFAYLLCEWFFLIVAFNMWFSRLLSSYYCEKILCFGSSFMVLQFFRSWWKHFVECLHHPRKECQGFSKRG
jgi:hypothetical protein